MSPPNTRELPPPMRPDLVRLTRLPRYKRLKTNLMTQSSPYSGTAVAQYAGTRVRGVCDGITMGHISDICHLNPHAGNTYLYTTNHEAEL